VTDSKAAQTGGKDPRIRFEDLMAELDRIVRDLNAGDVELDDALALFETGVSRLREAGQLLDHAQGRVEELIESASGDLSVIGFETEPGPDEEIDGA
jgi:exodeoxyribonuclease VII small subunit